MAAQVYSIRIFAGVGVTTLITETPPAGAKWVLRDVDVYGNVGLSGARFTLEGELGQAIWTAVWDPNTTEAFQWRGRQVIEQGKTFGVKADQPIDVTVSGYQLTLP